MSGVNDYEVLNVRVKYSGGVAAYLNGNLVARFNLEDDFDSRSLSITDHDASVFSKFHVILSTAGIEEGSNVFSLEIHGGLSDSSSDPVVFDGTGVFGVEDCCTVVDSYSSITSTELVGTVAGIMDLDPYTYGELLNKIGTYIEWIVENLVGSKWNSFNIMGSSTVSSWGFDINAIHYIDDTVVEPVTILNAMNQRVVSRTKPQISVPVALAGFRRYRWQITKASSTTTTLGSIHMAYCKASGSVCPGIDNYPSVGEGQISPSSCPDGYNGYSYRECSGGVLGEVKMDHCIFLTRIYLPSSFYSFVIHQYISFTIDMNNVTNCIITPSLPQGLILDLSSCTVSGTFTSSSFSSYNVTAISDSTILIHTVSIEILSSLISYPQTNLIIGQGLSFCITPTLTKVSTISIVSGSLPIGLSLNPSTGVISGIPSESISSQSVTIEAVNGTAIGTVVLSFTVLTLITSFSYPQSIFTLTKNEAFSITPSVDGEQVLFSISSGSLPTGLSLHPYNGIISGIPQSYISSQSVVIKAFNKVSNQTINMSFTVLTPITSFSYPQSTCALPIDESFTIAPMVNGDAVSFSITSGSLPIGLSINQMNGRISGIPLQSDISSQSVTIKAFNSISNKTAVISFIVSTTITVFYYPQISYYLLKNEPFSITPTINVDDSSFTIVSGSLPNGLSISLPTGVISGIPSQLVTSQSVTIRASNPVSNRVITLSFNVQIIPSSFHYPQTLFIIPKLSYFITTPTCQGNSLTYSIIEGSLPTGLYIYASTGMIHGTPLSSIPLTNITIQASNKVGSTQFTISILVIIPLSNLHYSQFSFTLIKGQSYSISPIISGDNPLFTITSGTLPPGLSLNQSTGIISGIPSSTFPSTSITIQAFNQLGFIQTQLSFTVNAPSTLTIILISLSILIIVIAIVVVVIRKKSHMYLYRKHRSRKLPISYPTRLSHTPQTNRPSVPVDNPPNMLSNIVVYNPSNMLSNISVYDLQTPSHSS